MDLGDAESITKILESNQKKLIPMIQLGTNLDVEMKHAKMDRSNESPLADSTEEGILLPEESKRAVNSDISKIYSDRYKIIQPIYVKPQARRRILPSVFTRLV